MWPQIILTLLSFCCCESLELTRRQAESNAGGWYDILGNGNREWKLFFRGTPYIGTSVYHAYRYGVNLTDQVEAGCLQMSNIEPCYHHYRNDIIFNHWANVEEAGLVVYQNGVKVHHVIFDARGTTFLTWFESSRIRSTDWSSLKSSKKNYVSIAGDDGLDRRFFINHNYGGCGSDAGWFVVHDTQLSPACSWENDEAYPMFLYARGDYWENWTHGDFRHADAFAIFVRFTPGYVIG